MTQFRSNNKRSCAARLMSLYYKTKIGCESVGVQFDALAYLMRYPKNIKLSDNVYIKSGARICPCNVDATIVIGSNTTIGYDTKIFSSNNITIGNNCMVAPNVYIVDSNHGMDRNSLMNAQNNTTERVSLGDDVWVGAGAVILMGAIIPNGCIIAANSVVKGNLEPYGIYAGSPAKKIGERK
jgi:acetyltransferase-like isoleucine patch superfamily enzyme